MYVITNDTNKARWCHDKLIAPNEEFKTNREVYVRSASLGAEIFSVKVVEMKSKIKNKEKEVKE